MTAQYITAAIIIIAAFAIFSRKHGLRFHQFFLVLLVCFGWYGAKRYTDFSLLGLTLQQWYTLIYAIVVVGFLAFWYKRRFKGDAYVRNRSISQAACEIIFGVLLIALLPKEWGRWNVAWILFYPWPLDMGIVYLWSSHFQGSGLSESAHGFYFAIGVVEPVLLLLFSMIYGRRFYCGWICGCGALADSLGESFRHLTLNERKASRLALLQLVVLIVTLLASFSIVYGRDPEIGGARTSVWYDFTVKFLLADVITLTAYFFWGGRFWCRFLCPLGTLLGCASELGARFFSGSGVISWSKELCRGDECYGKCTSNCPMSIDVQQHVHSEGKLVSSHCVGCGICVHYCPAGALSLGKTRPTVSSVEGRKWAPGEDVPEGPLFSSKSLNVQIMAPAVAAIVCFSAIVGIAVYRMSSEEEFQSLGENMKSLANTVASQLDVDKHADLLDDPTLLEDEDVKESYNELRSILLALKETGDIKGNIWTVRLKEEIIEGEEDKLITLVSTSDANELGLEYERYRDQIDVIFTIGQSLKTGEAVYTQPYSYSGKKVVTVFAPIKFPDGDIDGFVTFDCSAEPIYARLWKERIYIASASIIAAYLLAVVVSTIVVRTVVKPIGTLADGTKRISEGDLDHRVNVASKDEIGLLAGSFNTMTQRLQESIALIEAEQRRKRELEMAYEIQTSMLPNAPPQVEGYSISGMSIPSLEVGGDYYDFIEHGGEIGIAIGDVTGKGVPAALLMSTLRATLRAQAEHHFDLSEMMGHVNELISDSCREDMFITFFYARFNSEKGKLNSVNAGHNPPIILRKDGSYDMLETGGLILGVAKDIRYDAEEAKLRPGDVLMCYTDGVTEAINREHEEFGVIRLVEALGKIAHLDADEIKDAVYDTVCEFVGDVQMRDDFTCVVVKANDS